MDSPILGRDFTRPFDHQRRNARAKVRVEMPLTLKCAILYGALLCRGPSIESIPSVCTDKNIRIRIVHKNMRNNAKDILSVNQLFVTKPMPFFLL